MKIEKESRELKERGRIVLNNDILKEPNFKKLKEMLGLDDSAIAVDVCFKTFDVFKKVENQPLLQSTTERRLMNDLSTNSNAITVQVATMNDDVIASIDITSGRSIGIVQDGYKVFVNGKPLKRENSSANE